MAIDLKNLKQRMSAITVKRTCSPRILKSAGCTVGHTTCTVGHTTHLTLFAADVLDQAERLCRLWAALFSRYNTFALNDDRLRGILRRIGTEGHAADAVGWAILAYADHVERDAWHAEHGHPHTTLEDFLDPPSGPYMPRKRQDRFEDWLAAGESLRSKLFEASKSSTRFCRSSPMRSRR